MDDKQLYLLAANITMSMHVLFIAFIVIGLLLILLGKFRNWYWVGNPWFRLTHLIAILFVTLQTWLGFRCPLTDLEIFFREKAGSEIYQTSFIAHGLESLLYYHAPDWIFAVSYTLFTLLVVASWLAVKPRSFSNSKAN